MWVSFVRVSFVLISFDFCLDNVCLGQLFRGGVCRGNLLRSITVEGCFHFAAESLQYRKLNNRNLDQRLVFAPSPFSLYTCLDQGQKS